MGKPETKALPVITLMVLVLVTAWVTNYLKTYNMVRKVQAGHWELECVFTDGVRVVDPDQVVGFSERYGWEFNNGGAKNCTIRR